VGVTRRARVVDLDTPGSLSRTRTSGAGAGGKSTIVRQLRILWGQGYTEEEVRLRYVLLGHELTFI
jgi:hypothetical protein